MPLTIQETNIRAALNVLRPGVAYAWRGGGDFGNDMNAVAEMDNPPTEQEVIAAYEQIVTAQNAAAAIRAAIEQLLTNTAHMPQYSGYFVNLANILLDTVRDKPSLADRYDLIRPALEADSRFWSNFLYLLEQKHEIVEADLETPTDAVKRTVIIETEQFVMAGTLQVLVPFLAKGL